MTADDIAHLIARLRSDDASQKDACDAADVIEAERGDAEIVAAAKNLVAVKGRHHSALAYTRLAAAIDSAMSREGGEHGND